MRSDGSMGEIQLSKMRNMCMPLERGPVLARNFAYHRRATSGARRHKANAAITPKSSALRSQLLSVCILISPFGEAEERRLSDLRLVM